MLRNNVLVHCVVAGVSVRLLIWTQTHKLSCYVGPLPEPSHIGGRGPTDMERGHLYLSLVFSEARDRLTWSKANCTWAQSYQRPERAWHEAKPPLPERSHIGGQRAPVMKRGHLYLSAVISEARDRLTWHEARPPLPERSYIGGQWPPEKKQGHLYLSAVISEARDRLTWSEATSAPFLRNIPHIF